MMDIVNELQIAIVKDPDPWDFTLYERAANEIERLRELINVWVDLADDPSVDSKAYVEAENELRKAVNKPLIKRT
jgi:hypothetical protein